MMGQGVFTVGICLEKERFWVPPRNIHPECEVREKNGVVILTAVFVEMP
jgi:hypothetical protein